MVKKRIGVFSGTFDPVHEGHVKFVAAGALAADLDETMVIVEQAPQGKQPSASFRDRYAMVKRAFRHIDKLAVQPSKSSGTTFDDLTSLINGNDVFLLIGSDLVSGMKQWHGFLSTSSHISVIVGVRNDDDRTMLTTRLKSYNLQRSIVIDSPLPHAASSDARNNPRLFLPTITDYVRDHRLYGWPLV